MHTSPMRAAADMSRRPEQTFFQDPALDRVFGVVMALATEVHVTNAKLAAVQKALDQHGIRIDWDAQADEPALAGELAQDRQAFVQHLLDPLLGVQRSKGAA